MYETRWSDASRRIMQPTTLTLKRRRQTSAVIFILGLLFAAYFVDASAQLWSPHWINDARRDSASTHLRRNGKWYSGNWGAAVAFCCAADCLSERWRDGFSRREANVWRQQRNEKCLARTVDVIRDERSKTNERKCDWWRDRAELESRVRVKSGSAVHRFVPETGLHFRSNMIFS